MNLRTAVAAGALSLAVLTGCATATPPAAVSASVAAASSSAAGQSDVALCEGLVNEFKPLKEGPLQEVVDSGGTIDYATLSTAVGAYVVEVRAGAASMKDEAMKAAWLRVANNGDTAAQDVLAGNDSVSLTSLSTFIRSTTAAITDCTAHIETLTSDTPSS